MRRFAIPLLVVALAAGCSQGSNIRVTDAVIAEPAGSATALYFEVAVVDGSDRLIGVRTDVASASIHRSYFEGDQMHMEAVAGIDIEPGEPVSFEPGGYHVMLMDVEPLGAGQIVTVILEFEHAGDVEIAAIVRSYSEIAP